VRSKLKALYHWIEHHFPLAGALFRRATGRTRIRNIKKNISGKHNVINFKNGVFSSVQFEISGDHNYIDIGDDSTLNSVKFYIRGSRNRITLNKNCRFYHGGKIWISESDCTLSIGENSSFEDVSLVLPEPDTKIQIGSDCMFAYDIEVRTGDSHSIISSETGQRLNFGADIIIGDHVWVAAHCILLKGMHIASNSIIATGSVATKKFTTPGIIIGGNPARALKEGINWVRERIPRK